MDIPEFTKIEIVDVAVTPSESVAVTVSTRLVAWVVAST